MPNSVPFAWTDPYMTLATEVLLHFDAENTQENIPLLLNDLTF